MPLFAFFLLVISACGKDQTPEDFQLHFETNFPIKDILFKTDNTLLACGGEIFESGFLVETDSVEYDKVKIDTLSDKCLSSIQLLEGTEEPELFTTGVYTFGSKKFDEWKMSTVDGQFILRDVIYHDDGYVVIGGGGLSIGVISSYSWGVSSSSLHENFSHFYDYDLYFIEKIGARVFVGGFGLLMYTDDLNESADQWTILDEYEDHWIDISYREDVGILILGASGRIIRSKDGGQSFDEISSPHISGLSDYKDMLIYKDKIYLACGENICASEIENIDWDMIKLETGGEINRLAGNNDRIFFVTNSGKMASIAH